MPNAQVSKYVPTAGIAQKIEETISMLTLQRRAFTRRWYDNNFFDDGFHFRYVSRTTGKIIDLSDRGSINIPQRAIPKASRQIRGVANLLMQPEYRPVIYPEKVPIPHYEDPAQQQQAMMEYQKALENEKVTAQKKGQWVEQEFDNQEIEEKLIHMLLLAMKHSISWLQIWPDAVEEKIKSQVYDAFDIYVMGNLDDPSQAPGIIKSVPTLISEIKANELFDKEQLMKIAPDNKYASDSIKQAYMQSRFGSGYYNDQAATLLLSEGFFKEYITEENIEAIQQLANSDSVLEGKNIGDMVMRHCFSAGNVWLLDEYVDLPDYPFIDLRLEPGPIYQVPLIERFIPANKSLDLVVSRIERYINTMVSGTWIKRAGEDVQVSNIPGGQVLEYKTVPPVQGNIASVPPFVFNFIQQLENQIEEQGASTSALNQLPEGVKSGVAIESVKSTEYANLKIPSMMLKKTVRHIAEKLLYYGSQFIEEQTVYQMDKGQPTYFDVIGERGLQTRQKLGLSIPPQAVILKKDAKVDIEVESGLGFTMDGKKHTMQQIVDFMIKLSQQGMLTQDSVKVVVRKLLETYQFGATQEFMDAMDTGMQSAPLTEDQLTAIKLAVASVMKDLGIGGQAGEQTQVESTKVGVVEALKDTGMLNQQNQVKQEQPKGPSESISFKDLPPEGQVQMAAKAGIQLTKEQIPDEKEVEGETNATT